MKNATMSNVVRCEDWENRKFCRSAFRDFKKRCRRRHCSCVCRIFPRLNTVSSDGQRSNPSNCIHSYSGLVAKRCRKDVDIQLSMISRDMFASSRRTDAVADDPVVSKETRRRRCERRARSQTLQPEVTTSSLLG